MKTLRDLVETYQQMNEGVSEEKITFYGVKRRETIILGHLDKTGRSNFYEITTDDHDGYRTGKVNIKKVARSRGKELGSVPVTSFVIDEPYRWNIDDQSGGRSKDTLVIINGEGFQVECSLDEKDDYYPSWTVRSQGSKRVLTNFITTSFMTYTAAFSG